MCVTIHNDLDQSDLQSYTRVLLTADQIRRRVQEIARQINTDFQDKKTLYVVGVL